MAFDAFLKIDGISGESTDRTYKEWIEVLSFDFGATQSITSGAGGGAGAGKVSLTDFHFISKVNKASPQLMLACATGQHIKSASVSLITADTRMEFLKLTLSDVLVSSYSPGGKSAFSVPTNFTVKQGGLVGAIGDLGQVVAPQADPVPTDTLGLRFMKIRYEVLSLDGKTWVTTEFDTATNAIT